MITVRLQGGMGNQMFQYACGRALAMKNHTAVALDTGYLLDRRSRKNFTFRGYDLDVFSLDAEIVSNPVSPWQIKLAKLKNKIWKTKGVERSLDFDSSILSLGPDAYLQGYWQSPKYFADVAETIRKDFTIKKPLPQNIAALADEIKKTASVCIHVRRGDYVGHGHHDIGLGQSYYDQGIAYISGKHSIEKIYVFSDDIEWCAEHLHFSSATMFVGSEYSGQKGEGHLFLMSMCKDFIIPNSTFSWWGAWLAASVDKIVIAPKQWFTGAGNAKDLIPEEWVRL